MRPNPCLELFVAVFLNQILSLRYSTIKPTTNPVAPIFRVLNDSIIQFPISKHSPPSW